VHRNASQLLAGGLEVSGIKIETLALISSCITTIGPNCATTLVMEPGKFVALLDFFGKGWARSGNQCVAVSKAKAVFAVREFDVTYVNEMSKSYILSIIYNDFLF
jgi:hypothetical protein